MEGRTDSFAAANCCSLQIYRSNRKCGKITGNDEVILFCSQIEDKNDIEVEFVQYESRPLASSLVSSSIASTTAAITSPSLASSQSHIFPSLDQSGRIIKWKELAFVDRDNIHANSVLIIRTPPYTCIGPVESKQYSQMSTNNHHHHHHHHQHHGRHSDYSRFFTKYNNKIKSKVEKVHYRLYRPSTGQRSEDWVFFYWLSESASSSPTAYAATALNQLHFLDTCCMFGAIYPPDNLKEQQSTGAANDNSNNHHHHHLNQQQHSISPPKEEHSSHSHSRSNSFRIVTGTLTKLFNKNNNNNNEKNPNESSNYESVESSLAVDNGVGQPLTLSSAEVPSSPAAYRASEPTINENSEHQSSSDSYHHYRHPSSSATTTTTTREGWQDPHDSPNQSKKNMKKARSNSILLDKILLIDSSDRASALKKSRTTTSFHCSTVDRLSNHDKKSTSYRNNLNEQVVNENSEVNSNTSSCTLVANNNKLPSKLRFDQIKSLPNGGSVQLSNNDSVEDAANAAKRSKDAKRRSQVTLSTAKPGKHKKCVIL